MVQTESSQLPGLRLFFLPADVHRCQPAKASRLIGQDVDLELALDAMSARNLADG
jgi:hypothetical protein